MGPGKDHIDPGFIRRIVIGSYGGGPGGERVFMHKMAERLKRVPHQEIEDDSHHASILSNPQDPDYKLHQFLNSMGEFYRVPHRDPRYQGLTRQSAYRWFGEAKGEKFVQDQEADYRKTYQHSNVDDQDGRSHS